MTSPATGADPVPPAGVRRATTADGPAISELWLAARRASVPAIPGPVHTDDEVHQWFADVVLPGKETWVAERDGSVVAVLVLEDGWIDQLYVHPAQCGRGIGSSLVVLAQRRQPSGLDLWTFAANVGARRFYERHGFVAVDATDGDNEEGAPDVRYQWPADRVTAFRPVAATKPTFPLDGPPPGGILVGGVPGRLVGGKRVRKMSTSVVPVGAERGLSTSAAERAQARR